MKGIGLYIPLTVILMMIAMKQLPHHTVSGVIDRFEGPEQAVILIEDLQKEFMIEKQKLPAGSKENMWLHLLIADETVEVLSIDRVKTMEEREKVRELLSRVKLQD